MLICVLQPTFSLTHSPWVPPPLAAGTISNATTRASSEAHKLHNPLLWRRMLPLGDEALGAEAARMMEACLALPG